MKKTKTVFYHTLPTKKQFLKELQMVDDTQILIIYDRHLRHFPVFSRWVDKFSYRLSVTSGEPLKSMESFSKHLEKVLKMVSPISKKKFKIVSVGGGSVGDFSGFMASVLKRGVGLVHVPTTWLSAMDSAHGGKTALNVGAFKNQIGTFYPADKILIVRSLLTKQPQVLRDSAYGELFKMALIQGGTLYSILKTQKRKPPLWALIPSVIRSKKRIVDQDPFEERGLRQLLNLGHTLGHIIEGIYRKPHGICVLYGCLFSLRWSHKRGYLSQAYLMEMEKILFKLLSEKDLKFFLKLKMPLKAFLEFLKQDKKWVSGDNFFFIYVKAPGKVFRKKVSLKDMCLELRRQGFLK